ncbi:hypothetical protein F5Y08DRAFT_55166 [Xylaria arbuscula]|nr:hypothetical protein F5Y08DRAFT_55166 [Xylaria arbuscula]
MKHLRSYTKSRKNKLRTTTIMTIPNGAYIHSIPQSVHALTDILIHSPICLLSFNRKSVEIKQAHRNAIEFKTWSALPGPLRNTTASVLGQIAVTKGRYSVHWRDDEILRLNACGHAFRAQCLVLWFLKGKYTCPVCRRSYYPPPETKKQKAMQEQAIHQLSFIPPV